MPGEPRIEMPYPAMESAEHVGTPDPPAAVPRYVEILAHDVTYHFLALHAAQLSAFTATGWVTDITQRIARGAAIPVQRIANDTGRLVHEVVAFHGDVEAVRMAYDA